LNIHVYPTPWFYAGFGFYDGSVADGVHTGENSPISAVRKPHHYFTVAEAGLRWMLGENKQLPGRFAAGAWHHNGDFARFNGGEAGGTTGFYAIAEQKLWHQKYYDRHDSRGIHGFVQYGWADPDVSNITQHLGIGLTWTGLIPKSNPDVMGIGLSAVELSNQAGFDKNYELNVEAFYGWVVTPYLLIKPDLQYIINPSGGNEAADALVASIRVELTL
jgi:porin